MWDSSGARSTAQMSGLSSKEWRGRGEKDFMAELARSVGYSLPTVRNELSWASGRFAWSGFRYAPNAP